MAIRGPRVRSLTSAQQTLKIQKNFPEFKHSKFKGISTWTGWLQPSDESQKYLVKIQHFVGRHPRVWVLKPELVEPIHVFGDGSLCLYYPANNEWTNRDLIADTIIPWTAEWLRLYELWQITDIWFGPEASHHGPKRG